VIYRLCEDNPDPIDILRVSRIYEIAVTWNDPNRFPSKVSVDMVTNSPFFFLVFR
jgi:hypothetical protein